MNRREAKSEGVGGRKETIDLCLIPTSHLSIFKGFAHEYDAMNTSLISHAKNPIKWNDRAPGRPAPSSEELITIVLA
jgi:hypothetical protein